MPPSVQHNSQTGTRYNRPVAQHQMINMNRTTLLLLSLVLLLAPSALAGKKEAKFRQGQLKGEGLAECSGIVASRRHEGVFWALNDSGNAPVLYAITHDGKPIAEFPVQAKNEDWEDLSIDDEGRLYIGEIGNNTRKRESLAVYRVNEPDPHAAAGKAAKAPLRVNRVWRLKFPGEPFDCESLFILGGKGYVIPKQLKAQEVTIYSFDLEQSGSVALEPVTTLPVRSPVTAAAVSPDGKQLAVLTVSGPVLFQIDGDVAAAGSAKSSSVLFVNTKMEAICFVPEGLLVTTESREMFLFKYAHFGKSKGHQSGEESAEQAGSPEEE